MKFAFNRQVAAVGATALLLLSMLSVGFVAVGAAQIDRSSGYVANETTVDTNGPTTIDVSLEAVNDTALDTDPLEVTTYVIDNETGDVVDNQTATLNSTGTATHSYDVDRGMFDVEVVTANESQATTYLNSSSFATTEDRKSGYEVGNQTVEVTDSTEIVYTDLAVANESSSNVSVTVDLLDGNGTLVAFDTITIEPNSTGSVEFNASDLDLAAANHTVEIYTTDSTAGGYVTISDTGTTEASSGFPILSDPDGSTSIPNKWLIIGALAAIGAAGAAYRER